MSVPQGRVTWRVTIDLDVDTRSWHGVQNANVTIEKSSLNQTEVKYTPQHKRLDDRLMQYSPLAQAALGGHVESTTRAQRCPDPPHTPTPHPHLGTGCCPYRRAWPTGTAPGLASSGPVWRIWRLPSPCSRSPRLGSSPPARHACASGWKVKAREARTSSPSRSCSSLSLVSPPAFLSCLFLSLWLAKKTSNRSVRCWTRFASLSSLTAAVSGYEDLLRGREWGWAGNQAGGKKKREPFVLAPKKSTAAHPPAYPLLFKKCKVEGGRGGVEGFAAFRTRRPPVWANWDSCTRRPHHAHTLLFSTGGKATPSHRVG